MIIQCSTVGHPCETEISELRFNEVFHLSSLLMKFDILSNTSFLIGFPIEIQNAL